MSHSAAKNEISSPQPKASTDIAFWPSAVAEGSCHQSFVNWSCSASTRTRSKCRSEHFGVLSGATLRVLMAFAKHATVQQLLVARGWA